MSFKMLDLLRKPINRSIFKLFSTSNFNRQFAKERPILRQQNRKYDDIGPIGWILLVIPASTFALGTWQVQRKKWKEQLLNDLIVRTSSDPVDLPDNLEELNKLEYRPLRVRGTFLHDKEMFMGPRSLLLHGDAATKSSLVSNNTNKSQGFLVITPLKLSDREETILVNRGWVPANKRDPRKRQKGQVEGEVNVIGVVRLHENRPNFSPKNQEDSNIWFYRDLNHMSRLANASPVYLDATRDFESPDGPIGGQTRISLRNEHLSYILTWYTLCGATSFMWYKKFLSK